MTVEGSSDKLDQAVADLFDGADPKGAARRVEKLLRQDPNLTARYTILVELHALLEARHASVGASRNATQGEGCEATEGGSPLAAEEACGATMAELWGLFDEAAAEMRRNDASPQGRSFSLGWSAALVALAACLVAVLALPQQGSDRSAELALRESALESRAIGVLTNATGAKWGDDSIRLLPSQLVAGQSLSLARGVAELTLTSGVVVVLRGPAEIDLLSPMRVRARRGVVRARVGETARGFILETPTTEVIDLGTEFGVDVDDESGATDVVVFEGKVDLQYVNRTGGVARAPRASSVATRQEIRLLNSGEGLHVDAKGAASRIVSIHSDAYPSTVALGPVDERPPLIRRVWDNLRDPEAAQYYQISRGGLRDDARAYVDRFHEWNGLDDTGLPPYLRGADYVQTFNADKLEPDLEVSVEIAAPARLYVLYDVRLRPPKWLTDRFVDTGDKVGVDEIGPPAMATGGFGPGVSINTVHSVWVTEVSEPGVLTLGALPLQEPRVSMYGIAATPWRPDLAGSVEPRLQRARSLFATTY